MLGLTAQSQEPEEEITMELLLPKRSCSVPLNDTNSAVGSVPPLVWGLFFFFWMESVDKASASMFQIFWNLVFMPVIPGGKKKKKENLVDFMNGC